LPAHYPLDHFPRRDILLWIKAGVEVARRWQRLLELYRKGGLRETALELFRKLAKSVWHREAVFIRGRIIDDQTSAGGNEPIGVSPVECMTLQFPSDIDAIKHELPASFRDSPGRLKERLQEGCIVILAFTRRKEPHGHEILGYLIAEKGVVSALGRKRKVAPDVLYGHYIEVLPEYRQTGIANVLNRNMEEYARRNGLRKYYSVVSTKNRIAARILRTKSRENLGKVERVTILGGIYMWETPGEEIERILRKLDA
jgi:ribosomal protein S18 acetylase RimI-like enzyme